MENNVQSQYENKPFGLKQKKIQLLHIKYPLYNNTSIPRAASSMKNML